MEQCPLVNTKDGIQGTSGMTITVKSSSSTIMGGKASCRGTDAGMQVEVVMAMWQISSDYSIFSEKWKGKSSS